MGARVIGKEGNRESERGMGRNDALPFSPFTLSYPLVSFSVSVATRSSQSNLKYPTLRNASSTLPHRGRDPATRSQRQAWRPPPAYLRATRADSQEFQDSFSQGPGVSNISRCQR